jgi:hypothetical protein
MRQDGFNFYELPVLNNVFKRIVQAVSAAGDDKVPHPDDMQIYPTTSPEAFPRLGDDTSGLI